MAKKRKRTFGKGKLGSGSRFAQCVKSVRSKGYAKNPEAVCASIGRKKYGKARFQKLSVKGRRRHHRKK